MESLWIVRLAVNAVALYAAIYIVPGLQGSVINENWATYAILGLIFGLVNVFIRPIVKLITCPFYILTLGLFSLIVNTILFWLTLQIGSWFDVTRPVNDFWALFLGAIVVSLVSMVLYWVIPGNGRPRSSVKRPT
ncbi:MAG TPA: phage holin family protein [Anaerolineales bacterium]|nr:phage holin family protein [Anaerolineales bacterium]